MLISINKISSSSSSSLRNFQRVDIHLFLLTQKAIERFNENCFKSRKVKKRATSSENRKFFVAAVKSAFSVVKEMLTNGGLVKLSWRVLALQEWERL